MRTINGLLLCLETTILACSGIPSVSDGGSNNASGASGIGGAGAGGSVATGGLYAGTGGLSLGGFSPSGGGSAAIGGEASTTGGANAAGGDIATGGIHASGGSITSGGTPAAGGESATGRATAGDASSTGGTPATGGFAATGGKVATGGAYSTGGTGATSTGLVYRGHNVSGYGLVYDSAQDLTWTQLGELSPTAASWGMTQTLVNYVNTVTYYGTSGGWRLPLAAELQGLYVQLPSLSSNRTGIQRFGTGSNDFNYVAHPSYWSRYEVGTNLVYVFFFNTGNVVLTMESIDTFAWLVRDGNVPADVSL